MKLKKTQKFTLIEILVSCTIILIIIGITLGVYNMIVEKVANSKTEALVKQISAAMQAYRMDQGYYFSNTNAYGNIDTKGSVSLNNYFYFNFNSSVDTEFVKLFDYDKLLTHGYIKTSGGSSYFVDAWGVPLLYKSPGEFNAQMFDLGSLGKDGFYGDSSSSSSNFGKGDDITNFNF